VSKKRIGALIGALLSLALLAYGCGGGDETTALTRQQFINQANLICKKQRDRRNAKVAAAVQGRDQTKLLPLKVREDLVLETIPDYEGAYEQISELGAPDGDEERIDEIVEAMEESAQKVKAQPAQALVSTKQFQRANELSAEYGLSECLS